jgi:hypothetical protein
MCPYLHAAKVSVSWNANTETALAGYEIYKRTLPSINYGFPIFSGLPSNSSAPQTTVTNLAVGTFYGFIVTAFDSAGNESSPSIEASITISTSPPPPESGLTSLTAAHSQKCLEIPGSAQCNGAAATQSSCTGAANQQFQLKSVGTNTFQLIATHRGKCLEIAGSSTADGARVQQNACTTDTHQQFRITGSPSTLVAMHCDKCIDVAGVSTSDGATVVQWTCHGGLHQQWASNQQHA